MSAAGAMGEITIERIELADARTPDAVVAPLMAPLMAPLVALITDAVDGGASIGFHPPMHRDAAEAYWRGVLAVLGADKLLWLARDAGSGAVLGTVQLDRCGKQNGRHRAEVCKLMVMRGARRAGVATSLMAALEAQAEQLGVSLLVLDTEAGSPAETFYRRHGWQRVGEIPDYVTDGSGTLLATAVHFKRLLKPAS